MTTQRTTAGKEDTCHRRRHSTTSFIAVMEGPLEFVQAFLWSLISWEFVAVVLLMILLLQKTRHGESRLTEKVLQSVLDTEDEQPAVDNHKEDLDSSTSSIGNENELKAYRKSPDWIPLLSSTPTDSQENISNRQVRSEECDLPVGIDQEQKMDRVLILLEDLQTSMDTMAHGLNRIIAIWNYVENNNLDFWKDTAWNEVDFMGDRTNLRMNNNFMSYQSDEELPFQDCIIDDNLNHETTILDTSDSHLLPDDSQEDISRDSCS